MPIVLTADEQAAALSKGSSDLSFLLGAESVHVDTQAKFFHIGVLTVPQFAVLAGDDKEFRDLLKAEFSLDREADLVQRVQVGNLLIAFQRAQNRSSKESELEAEYSARRMQRPLKTSEYAGMRSAWETRWWKLDDRHTPARSYLEERCDQLESGDFHVETLSKVINREEDSDPGVQTFFDGTGKLQIRRGACEVPLPSTPEHLRFRLKVWGVGLQMMALKHANLPGLQGLNPQDVEDYLSYLLGEHVHGLTGRTASGDTVSAPSWPQLLIYEQQIRKMMYSLMIEEAVPAPEALRRSYRDPVVKERHFTTPTALAATSKQPFDSYNQNSKPHSTRGKGGKGANRKAAGPYNAKGAKGKGGGRSGKGKKNSGECFPFNNHWEKCTRKNCPFPHTCSRCGGKHPAYQCQNQGGSETQGSGHVATA